MGGGGDFAQQIVRQIELEELQALQSSKPGRGCSQCKGPEAGLCLAYLRTIKEASVAGTEWEDVKGVTGADDR